MNEGAPAPLVAKDAPPHSASIAAHDAPLFVTSFPRSGTTLLRAMLQSHPALAVLPETRWMVGLLKALRAEPWPLSRDRAEATLRSRIPARWLAVAELDLADAVALLPDPVAAPADVVSAVGRAYAQRLGKSRWGVKYPGVEFRRGLRLLHASFPAGTFVFLARDPRDVYLSQVRAGLRAGTADLALFSFLWALQTRKLLRDLERIGERAAVVRYEDLIGDPAAALRSICRLGGLADDAVALDAMLDYAGSVQESVRGNPIHRNVDRPILASNARRFEAELSPVQIRQAELAAGPVLCRLGYPVSGAPGVGNGRWAPLLRDYVVLGLAVGSRLTVNLARAATGQATPSGLRRRMPRA